MLEDKLEFPKGYKGQAYPAVAVWTCGWNKSMGSRSLCVLQLALGPSGVIHDVLQQRMEPTIL